MHALDILGDPVRRRILEILAEQGESSSGEIVEVIAAEFGITQSAVSQQLKTLRDAGFTTVTAEGTRPTLFVRCKTVARGGLVASAI